MENVIRLGKIRKIDPARKYGIITEEEDMSSSSFSADGSGGNVIFELDDAIEQLKEGQLVQFVKAEGKATRVVPLLDPK